MKTSVGNRLCDAQRHMSDAQISLSTAIEFAFDRQYFLTVGDLDRVISRADKAVEELRSIRLGIELAEHSKSNGVKCSMRPITDSHAVERGSLS